MRFGSPPTLITLNVPEGLTDSTWPSRWLLTYVLTGAPVELDNTTGQ